MTILSGSCGGGTGCTGCTGCTGGLTSLRTLTAAVSGLSPPKKVKQYAAASFEQFFSPRLARSPAFTSWLSPFFLSGY